MIKIVMSGAKEWGGIQNFHEINAVPARSYATLYTTSLARKLGTALFQGIFNARLYLGYSSILESAMYW